MSATTRQRIAAIDQVVAATGKPRSEVLRTLAPTWALSPFERARLEHELASTPTPGDVAAARAVEASATAAAERRATERDARALDTFRQFQAGNPFERARLSQHAAAEIQRGRELARALASTTDTPPLDAA